MKIISAAERELDDIVSLNHHVQRIHHEAHPDVFKPVSKNSEIEEFFRNKLVEEYNVFLVAYKDSDPIGYVWYRQRNTNESPLTYSRLVVSVHHLAVHESYRHMNVGSRLLGKVKEHATEIGASSIELDTWYFNSGARTFFESGGFEVYNVKMWNRGC